LFFELSYANFSANTFYLLNTLNIMNINVNPASSITNKEYLDENLKTASVIISKLVFSSSVSLSSGIAVSIREVHFPFVGVDFTQAVQKVALLHAVQAVGQGIQIFTLGC